MELRLRIIRDAYQAYSTSIYNMGFFFVALLYLILKNDKKKRELLLYSILGIVVLSIPVLANRLLTVGGDFGSYWMLYGVLCSAVIIAYAAAEVLAEQKTKGKKVFYAVCFVLALQFSVGFAYSTDYFGLSGNFAKASNEVVVLAEELKQIAEPCVIAPAEVSSELKKYDKNIKIIYGSDVSYDSDNLSQFITAAEGYQCNCVIVADYVDKEDWMLQNGYRVLAATANYKLYTK